MRVAVLLSCWLSGTRCPALRPAGSWVYPGLSVEMVTCPGDIRGEAFCRDCFKCFTSTSLELRLGGTANHSRKKVLQTWAGGFGPVHTIAGLWGPEWRIWQKCVLCDRGCCLSSCCCGNSLWPRLKSIEQSPSGNAWGLNSLRSSIVSYSGNLGGWIFLFF